MVRRMFIVEDARVCEGSYGGGLVIGCGDGGVFCGNPNALSVYLTSWSHAECIALVGGCTTTTVRPVRSCMLVRSFQDLRFSIVCSHASDATTTHPCLLD